MSANLKTCLSKLSVIKIYAWSDSNTVLYWLKDKRKYKTFVSNIVSKIMGKSFIEQKYVPIKENPTDFGSRGCEICT